MIVSDFIDVLKKMPQDSIIIMSKDAEGDNYSPLYDIEQGSYLKENSWSGEVFFSKEKPKNTESCVVLWPTN